MKKLLFAFALLFQTAFVFATDNQANQANVASVRFENVKMYRQASTSTDVIRTLKGTDEIVILRSHNTNWTIVTVNGEAGYVLTSELKKQDVQPKSIAYSKTARRK